MERKKEIKRLNLLRSMELDAISYIYRERSRKEREREDKWKVELWLKQGGRKKLYWDLQQSNKEEEKWEEEEERSLTAVTVMVVDRQIGMWWGLIPRFGSLRVAVVWSFNWFFP